MRSVLRICHLEMAMMLFCMCSIAFAGAGDNPYQGKIVIKNENRTNATFTMPKLGADEEIHIILEVRDGGQPALYSYRRIVVKQSAVSRTQ